MAGDRSMLGTTIANKYRIEGVLGEGGMGVVYQGTHEGTGGKVAVKMLRKEAFGDQEHFDRFELEARVSSRIETGHVIRVYDCGRESGAPFLVMELLKGDSLAQLITRNGPLPEKLALKVIAQAALGLGRAHAAGVIHRDIKTDNLFLAEVDDAVVVKVLDFGIAKLRKNVGDPSETHRLTETGRLLGTPLYMSPEQAQGLETVDHRTDIWSLGVVLFEALTGKPPLHRVQNLGKLIVELCAAPPPALRRLLPDSSPEVEDILARALMLDPSLRFESIDAFRAAILRALGTGHHVAVAELGYERIETPSERGVLSTDRLVLPTTVSKSPTPRDTKRIEADPVDTQAAPSPSPRGPHDATLASRGAAANETTHPDGTPMAARDAPPRVEAIDAPPRPQLVAHPQRIDAPPSSALVVPRRSSLATWAVVGALVVAAAAVVWLLTRDEPSATPAAHATEAPTATLTPPPLAPEPSTDAIAAPTNASATPTAKPTHDAVSSHVPTARPRPSTTAVAPTPTAVTPADPPHAGTFE